MLKEELLDRRTFLALSAAASALPLLAQAQTNAAVRIGLSPVFLDDQLSFLNDWRDYLQGRIGRAVRFVQRGSYREIMDLLLDQKLDFAWICGYPYVRHKAKLQLLAVPVSDGRPQYRSYLIVPASDTQTGSILDLRGKVFAYSDPDSNSGFLYPRYALMQLKENPDRFFAKTFFTWAHRKIVEAVGSNLAQGGAVDSYVWETLRIYHPELTERTRIVEKSPYFGHTPVVARDGVSRMEFDAMQEALLGMSQSVAGKDLLKRLNLDGFVTGEDALFDGIARMMRALNGKI
ncbi:MAG: PhnD/SsuA/transferrin family substrate-binding protein [Rhodocyclaceae bacterium]|nr:PhnD/SsuA/transferrin family substrate-binding protein [Rhodocyclaceae bacterium]MCB1890662.1 PhnD/SsuA/transferrin family substrate-binding protein [Rhodocyclaceae bacterium]